jgi:MAF protein
MLILASGSPRRQALLSLMGVDFHVQTSDIDESVIPGESPEEYVLRLAISKSLAFNPLSEKHLVVIAADTAVVDGDQILGKPRSPHHAFEMLAMLRYRTHTVISGLAVRDTKIEEIFTDLCTTRVEMRNYNEHEIEDYVASGDPMDKAGAYAIQHSGFQPVSKITGCFANVVGLPLCHLGQIFNRLGVDFREERIEGCRSNGSYQCQLVENINAMDAEGQ